MFRLSRINSPRATIVAIALLAVVLIAFGAIAQAHHPEAAVLASSDASGWSQLSFADILSFCTLRR